jgi:hypothetical protein
MIALVAVITVIIITIVNLVYTGYVASILWGWFIVPTFSLPQISTSIAIGITMLFRLASPQQYKTNRFDKTEAFIVLVLSAFLPQTIALLIGWLLIN